MKQTLRKYEIIQKRKEIEQVLKKGERVQTDNVILRFLPSSRKRIAFLVPKQIKTAVMRNLLRRRFREIYRRNKESFADGFDYILQARPNAPDQNFGALKEEIIALAKGITTHA
jgi:ribonuclease P protein component